MKILCIICTFPHHNHGKHDCFDMSASPLALHGTLPAPNWKKNIRTSETGSTCQMSWLSYCILRTQVGSWQRLSVSAESPLLLGAVCRSILFLWGIQVCFKFSSFQEYYPGEPMFYTVRSSSFSDQWKAQDPFQNNINILSARRISVFLWLCLSKECKNNLPLNSQISFQSFVYQCMSELIFMKMIYSATTVTVGLCIMISGNRFGIRRIIFINDFKF